MRALSFLALCALMGCELVVDFDRSRIVEDSGVDAEADGGADEGVDSGVDAGEDTGADDASGDAADAGDASDAGGDAAMDAADGDMGMCMMADECDDEIDCTTNECTGGACVFTPDDAACDDSNACTRDSCGDGCSFESCSVSASADVSVLSVLRLSAVDGGEGGLLVAVFEDDGGSAGMSIGAATLAAGAQTDVDVVVTRDLVDGETVYVQLFNDLGTVGSYDDGVDTPALDEGGAEVSESLMLNVPAGTPSFSVRTTGDGVDFTFAGALPSAFADGADPMLVLERGARYRIENGTAAAHPFELIRIDTPDVIQLAQGAPTGGVEDDATIDWVEDGDDVLFTVSAAFEAAVDGYRCTAHPTTMRGAIVFADPS